MINLAALSTHLIRNLTVQITDQNMKFNTALVVAGTILLNIAGKFYNITKLNVRVIVFVSIVL